MADNFAVTRHRSTGQLGDTQADTRKFKTPPQHKIKMNLPAGHHLVLPDIQPNPSQNQNSKILPLLGDTFKTRSIFDNSVQNNLFK